MLDDQSNNYTTPETAGKTTPSLKCFCCRVLKLVVRVRFPMQCATVCVFEFQWFTCLARSWLLVVMLPKARRASSQRAYDTLVRNTSSSDSAKLLSWTGCIAMLGGAGRPAGRHWRAKLWL